MKSKETVEHYLENVDYSHINSSNYIPSAFALKFMNFIKLVNANKPEDNKTPAFHLKMLDTFGSEEEYIANLLFRGAGKTTVLVEYVALYVAVFGELPYIGSVNGMLYVADSMENGAKNARDNIQHRYEESDFLQHWIPEAHFTDSQLRFKNREGKKFGINLYGAQTGIRGTKIFGDRPQLAILDDLIKDKDAYSPTTLRKIEETIYKGVLPALDPNHRKVVLLGTPFNKEDLVIKAIESGKWAVNVWPVCEKFPVPEEEFVSAWPDRFTYKFVKAQYDLNESTGNVNSFLQEYMLQLTSDEERLVRDADIRWYSRDALIKNKGAYNFYITTDFATSEKESSDYSVISVWAYNNNGDWLWVDGIAEKHTMDKNIDALFEFVSLYKPQQVGVEISGQQGGFIQWLEKEMVVRNVWFNFASSSKNGQAGIRPTSNKLTRFNLVVPWFRIGKIMFPAEYKDERIMQIAIGQIKLATVNGIKGKDDFLDTISQLPYLNAWKPSEDVPTTTEYSMDMWEQASAESSGSNISSYIV